MRFETDMMLGNDSYTRDIENCRKWSFRIDIKTNNINL